MHVNGSVGKTQVLFIFYVAGAAAARDGPKTGTFKVTAELPNFGRLDIGITEQYTHLGSVGAGPHKYDQEVESMVSHAQATSKHWETINLATKAYHPKRQAHSVDGARFLKTHFPLSNLRHFESLQFEKMTPHTTMG